MKLKKIEDEETLEGNEATSFVFGKKTVLLCVYVKHFLTYTRADDIKHCKFRSYQAFKVSHFRSN